MLRRRRARPEWLIAAGLFGMVLYTATLRTGASGLSVSDWARGAWVGVCLGLALVGVTLQVRRRTQSRI